MSDDARWWLAIALLGTAIVLFVYIIWKISPGPTP